MEVPKDNFTSVYTHRFLVILTGTLFIFKALVLFYLSYLAKCSLENQSGLFYLWGGDSSGYLEPIENYIKHGSYFIAKGNIDVFAGRMPFYGIIYFCLRHLFSVAVSYDVLVILQIAMECISIVYLGLLARLLFRTSFSFWATIVVASLSLYVSYWSLYLLPESLSVSFLVLGWYYYLRYRTTGKIYYWLAFSFAFVFLVVLKPYFIPLLGFIFLDLFTNAFSFTPLQLGMAFKNTMITAAILLFFLSPWIIRNYVSLHKFIPFQESTTAEYQYTESDFACRRFIQAWGGAAGVYWDKKSAACYFMLHPTTPCEFRIPEYAYTKEYSLAEIDSVKDKYLRLQMNFNDSLNIAVTHEFDRLTSLFVKEKPFRYYIISPITIAINFLFHSGSYYLPISASFSCYHAYQFVIKLSQTFLYYLVLLSGGIGLILLFSRQHSSLLIGILPVYIITFFCFYLRAGEYRYFLHAYPALILGTVASLEALRKKWSSLKTINDK